MTRNSKIQLEFIHPDIVSITTFPEENINESDVERLIEIFVSEKKVNHKKLLLDLSKVSRMDRGASQKIRAFFFPKMQWVASVVDNTLYEKMTLLKLWPTNEIEKVFKDGSAALAWLKEKKNES